MKRRTFITLVGGAATWPIAARAQQPAMPIIAWITTGSEAGWSVNLVGFRQGLAQTGYVEGRNVAVEYCWGDDQPGRLASCVAELVPRKVSVIVASPVPAALAAKTAAPTIPIVFQIGADPVRVGLVASFNRPGGNVLHAIAPNATTIAVLVDPQALSRAEQLVVLQEAARALGVGILTLDTRDIDTAFANLVSQHAGALFVAASSYWVSHREQIVSLAARHQVPTCYKSRDFAAAGGLMSYGTDFSAAYRQVGIYTGRILKGEKPSDLPVLQPTKFEFVINLKAAKALDLTVPDKLLALADEVIQ